MNIPIPIAEVALQFIKQGAKEVSIQFNSKRFNFVQVKPVTPLAPSIGKCWVPIEFQ